MNEVTKLLSAIEGGDTEAADELLAVVYDELRRLAAAKLASEKPGQTLQATALVHDAYIRLVEGANDGRWTSRAHFFGAAAEAMRRILIEQARRKQRQKRGGGRRRVELSESNIEAPRADADLLALNEALQEFQQAAPQKAELVKLRYFAGLTVQEAADVLGVSASTADNYWAYARSWLRLRLSDDR